MILIFILFLHKLVPYSFLIISYNIIVNCIEYCFLNFVVTNNHVKIKLLITTKRFLLHYMFYKLFVVL